MPHILLKHGMLNMFFFTLATVGNKRVLFKNKFL